MKSAKEMFEDLGYEEVIDEYDIIVFDCKGITINFFPDKKIFSKEKVLGVASEITMGELVAINQMVKELGWNE